MLYYVEPLFDSTINNKILRICHVMTTLLGYFNVSAYEFVSAASTPSWGASEPPICVCLFAPKLKFSNVVNLLDDDYFIHLNWSTYSSMNRINYITSKSSRNLEYQNCALWMTITINIKYIADDESHELFVSNWSPNYISISINECQLFGSITNQVCMTTKSMIWGSGEYHWSFSMSPNDSHYSIDFN